MTREARGASRSNTSLDSELVLIRRDIELPATPTVAWALLVDWERQADWMLDAVRVDVVSQQRSGPGVLLAVKTRVLGIPAFTDQLEVTDWDPPHRLVISHRRFVAGTGTWLLEPTDRGSRFTWTEDVSVRVPVAGELALRFYRPVLVRLMDRGLDGFRRHVIACGPAPGSSV